MKFIYQFNKLNDQSVFYIESQDKALDSVLVIATLEGTDIIKEKIRLNDKPVSCSISENKIFLLFNSSLKIYDIKEKEFVDLKLPRYKFEDVVDFNGTDIIYTLKILGDLHFYKESVKKTENSDGLSPEMVAVFNLESKDWTKFDNSGDVMTCEKYLEDLFEKKKIAENINKRIDYLSDFQMGEVQQGFSLNNGHLIFTFSSLVHPTEVFFWNNKTKEIKRVEQATHKKIDFDSYNVVFTDYGCLLSSRKSQSNKVMCVLQGGPRTSLDLAYKEYYRTILNQGYDILVINYWKKFKIRDKQVNVDKSLKIIKESLHYTKDYEVIKLLGFSFGGYIALLFNQYNINNKLDDIYIVGGFTSLNYQKVFSTSKDLIEKIFDFNTDLSRYNPMDCYDDESSNKIIFIHGQEDMHAPIRQIELFNKSIPNSRIHVLSDYSHFNIGYEEEVANALHEEMTR